MNGSGNFIITWTDDTLDDIYGQRFDQNGVKQGSEFQVDPTTTGNQRSSSIEMDQNGNFVVLWEDNNGMDTYILAQRSMSISWYYNFNRYYIRILFFEEYGYGGTRKFYYYMG